MDDSFKKTMRRQHKALHTFDKFLKFPICTYVSQHSEKVRLLFTPLWYFSAERRGKKRQNSKVVLSVEIAARGHPDDFFFSSLRIKLP